MQYDRSTTIHNVKFDNVKFDNVKLDNVKMGQREDTLKS
jgi:hypothetical protein